MRYQLWLGETLTLPFFIESGDPSGLTVTAWMRSSDPDLPNQQLGCTFRAAAGAVAAGWDVVISSLISTALDPGTYYIQLKFQAGAGDPQFSQSQQISAYKGPAS